MSTRGRNRTRNRAATAAFGGPSYDADAQAYIDATGELFPDDLNTLVLGIKAAGLWDDHIGSIKKAIGVPSLAASMIDLRNTAFNGTAVNTPTHSATAGWGFTAASSQYINSGWQVPATGSKATLDSVHIGVRLKAGGGVGQGLCSAYTDSAPERYCGFLSFANGDQDVCFHGGNSAIFGPTQNPVAPANYIGTSTGTNASATYVNGASAATSAAASTATIAVNVSIGALNNKGTPQNFFTGRVTLWHGGAGLDASQAAALNTLFDAYAAAAGET